MRQQDSQSGTCSRVSEMQTAWPLLCPGQLDPQLGPPCPPLCLQAPPTGLASPSLRFQGSSPPGLLLGSPPNSRLLGQVRLRGPGGGPSCAPTCTQGKGAPGGPQPRHVPPIYTVLRPAALAPTARPRASLLSTQVPGSLQAWAGAREAGAATGPPGSLATPPRDTHRMRCRDVCSGLESPKPEPHGR